MGVVQAIIRAHDICSPSMHTVSKGPEVELVQGLIINVGREGLDVMIFRVYAGIAVQFLLVANEVLVMLASDM